jgi:UDP-2-acetamido-3-amino-2,3-dideoxy-glucuronate N-acetyltransferase
MSHFVHPTAIVEDGVVLGEGTRVWHFAHVRKDAHVGHSCILGKSVFVDVGVRIGNCVKIQNNVSVYHGVDIEDGVFLGPHVCFTHDLNPRSILPDGTLRGEQDWVLSKTHVGYGVGIGANSTIRAGISIGKWALIGAGSVVTKDVPPYALVYGNPARVRGVVAPTGEIVSREYKPGTYKTTDGAVTFEVPATTP